MNGIKSLPLKNITVDDPFWGRVINLVREKVIPYQWEVLNDRIPDAAKSHCIKNFEIAAGRRNGEFYGMVFQDSDLYKWLEAAAYSLDTRPDPELEKLTDSAVELIGSAQQADGYINTYYTVKEPDGRWSNLQQGHELYCAGHLIEAAVAYYNATGKRDFLDIAIRFADYIDSVFRNTEGYPGHQEIELALAKLYRVTGEKRYLTLAGKFIRRRGSGEPHYFIKERQKPQYRTIWPQLEEFDAAYSQSHIPPLEQRHTTGHAVRAVYMYTAMADLALEDGNAQMRGVCEGLFDNITKKQMYITGAIGSTSIGEAFTTDYDLPSDLIYGETCASIGLMIFCQRMNALSGDARYADTIERALYNTVLAGMSLSGTEFFYVNPLEADPARLAHSPDLAHIKNPRQKWFDCSCCPTNIARTVMGLGEYIYRTAPDGLYVNLYCSGTAEDGLRSIAVKTGYPYADKAVITVSGGRYKLFLRNPENAPILSLSVGGLELDVQTQNGYVVLERDWNGNEIVLRFDMRPKIIYTSPKSQNNNGKAAVMRGPLVYCAEQADNGENLGAVILPSEAAFAETGAVDGLPPETVMLKSPAHRYTGQGDVLYTAAPPKLSDTEVKLVPYFLWANRNVGEMRVFLHHRI
ncbi:MAG: glycoside hydrolase family 127 protein [Oscillospiraceae bacterium]|nr:glycoside hydrolase family 127 protein [Oscillospiraceae bacterium]